MREGIGFAVATIAGNEARRKRLAAVERASNNQSAPHKKTRFNRTDYPCDKESRRDTQFKFFGYRPKRFISIYAKKPRILVKVKDKPDNSNVTNIDYNDSRTAYIDRQMAALYQQQMLRGTQYSAMGYNQMAAVRQANHGLGGLVGMSGGLGGVGVATNHRALY